MKDKYFIMCDHWTQGGIGLAFPEGWYNGKYFKQTYSSIYTIEKMLDAADEYGVVASIDLDAYAYDEIMKESPETIERFKQYIKEGKASADGGSYGQPLGQDYNCESNIRQFIEGRKTIKKLLDQDVKSFIVEEQWFHPQMPQILKKSGIEYASLQCHNSGQIKHVNKNLVNWVGKDNTKIRAIPNNELMLSCVRQYADYSEYLDVIERYDNPMIFQWVEVWAPGMDWGASISPFEKAITHVKDMGFIPCNLTTYFEKTKDQDNLDEIRFELNESNYGNDWYQGGGWGKDGDKIIYKDVVNSAKLTFCESIDAMVKRWNQSIPNINELWKRTLFLQNHDFSCARTYRAFDEEGIMTNAGSFGEREYQRITNKLQTGVESLTTESEDTYLVNFGFSNEGREIKINKDKFPENFNVEINDQKVDYDVIDNEVVLYPETINGFGKTKISIEKSDESTNIYNLNSNVYDDDNVNIEYENSSWNFNILDKKTNKKIKISPFSGMIGKANEHDETFHALSPGHQIFTFAFDGYKHCYDQTSLTRISLEHVKKGIGFVEFKLKSTLLSLFTTDTPVAFAEVKFRYYIKSKTFEVLPYLYTGVPLNVNAFMKIKIYDNVDSYRSYPFGEELSKVKELYTSNYARYQKDDFGMLVVSHGTQRFFEEKNTNSTDVKFLMSRGRMLNSYEWKFTIKLDVLCANEAYSYAQAVKSESQVLKLNYDFKDIDFFKDANLITTAFYFDEDIKENVLRVINFSDETIEVELNDNLLQSSDFLGTEIIDVKNVKFTPWEIKTFIVKD